MRYSIGLFIALLCAVAGVLPVEARRVALVIGNNDYKIGPLANPVSDAVAVAKAFQTQLKFDKVLLRKNLSLDGFRAALREIAAEASGAEVGAIYFAGHGIEVGGRNYLVPVDAQLNKARDVELEAIALDVVKDQLEGVTKLKLVILDACRNNPFAAAGGKRTVTRGLARIEPEAGTVVAYAAKEGTTADDGTGTHSPFTAALLGRIGTPNLDVRLMFGFITDDVLAATNRMQEPFVYARLGGQPIYLVPGSGAVTAPAPPVETAAAREWARIDKSSLAELETFQRRYPTSAESQYAGARIAELKKQQMAAATVPKGAPRPVEPKEEELPFWAVGRPKSGPGASMAPIAAPPVPTPARKLPKLQVPAGFKVEVYQAGLLDARALRRGDQGTIFVSSLFVAGKIYAITDRGGYRTVKTVLSGLELPSGIEFHKGALYVATPKKIVRYDGIEDRLDRPPAPVDVYTDLPGDVPHGWKYLRFGPDGKLYVPVGAPCNICEPDPARYAQIFRINADGSGREIVAKGVRNSVGFDFHPVTKQLWFTDNQRDWMGEDIPLDELNVVKSPGRDHFGFPYCHSGIITDPRFGWKKSCADYVSPVVTLGPHSAPLGMKFYTGKSFPAKYQGAILIARHGPWNRTKKFADVVVVYVDGQGKASHPVAFVTGWVKDNDYLGRPVDIMQQPDGSILISDDYNGAIYRVSYGR